jgi:hypothetical protein
MKRYEQARKKIEVKNNVFWDITVEGARCMHT